MNHKELSELTLQELWMLFPVILSDHKDYWADWYREETELLQNALSGIERISHIGSTAVNGICAKPTIDILAEIPARGRLADFKAVIEKCGYICMAESDNRMDFNKGYTPQGFAERVFHLHLRHSGDNDELYFRDYLAENPDVAAEYERLKLDIWEKYKYDRDAYTHHKGDFVKRYTEIAKILFAGRYSTDKADE